MADRTSLDPLSEFDELLRGELAEQPSQHFLLRVRERIRTEPPPTRWPFWRIAVPLTVAALLALAIAASVWKDTPPDPHAQSASVALNSAATKPLSPALRVPSTEQRVPSTEYRVPTTEYRAPGTEYRIPSTEHRAPDVLVDPRQRDALLSFMRLLNRGQLTDDAFKLTTPPPIEVADQVTTIAIQPLVVSPILVGGVLQPELERK
jgi:hypothetical protein